MWHLLRRRRRHDIAAEIESHIALATRDRIERGVPPDEARAAALREFGNVALIQQTTREVWAWTAAEQVFQDMRFGARVLWQAPGFSLTAIVLIALVVGGNTTIYSIVNGLLVSPAPGVTAPGLVAIKHAPPGALIADPLISYPNYLDYARLATSLDRLAGWSTERLTVRTGTGNYAVFGALITPDFFETFGVALAQGRAFDDADNDAGQAVAVVISHRLWREQFEQAADVLGRTMHVNSVPVTVVGVAAPEFSGVLLNMREDVWLPIAAFRHASGTWESLIDRARPAVVLVGRRREGVSPGEVRAEFSSLARQLRDAFPDAFTTLGARGTVVAETPAVDVRPYSVAGLLPLGDLAPRFLALFSLITLLTLIVVSGNVANLMLGRAIDRQRDTAVRQSLGASRTRVLRMLMAEGAAIALVAWIASCVLAWWTARLLLRTIEPVAGATASVRPDWTTAVYAMALAAATTLAFSVAPAIRAWSLPVLPLLRSGEQATTRGRSRVSNALVVLQLAFAVLLLTSAGLAYRSLGLLDSGDVGFDPQPMLLVTVRMGEDQHEALSRLERVRQQLAQLDPVRAVSYSRRAPGPYFLGTAPVQTVDGHRAAEAFVRSVGPDYLASLGLHPTAGRDLAALDRQGAPAVAVINERLARELFPGTPPLGQPLFLPDLRTTVHIVGVAPHALVDGAVHDPQPRYVFLPAPQMPETRLGPGDMHFVVRYDDEDTLEAVTPLVTRTLAAADATLPIVRVSTMQSRLAEVTLLERQITMLLVVFALTSLLIAALGQYASAMFNIRRRTRDLGVRMALGASAQQIQTAVIREALLITVPGLVIGFALSAVVARAAQSLLFGVTTGDALTHLGVLALLTATSLIASSRPAWRASRVDVMDALRQD